MAKEKTVKKTVAPKKTENEKAKKKTGPNLVIVESPFKAPTIRGYLGAGYRVIASVGHVRDLPKSQLGVDIENGFEPKYINIRGKGEVIRSIREEAKNAGKIYLATDPDREGEAISWHLAQVLGIPLEQTNRITFNEVTKTAVKAAIKNPRHIDMALVDAQQARRILDRIVGYKISPLLWKNVHNGLSAGRVQSCAAKLIVEREEQIESFKPEEYWTISGTFALNGQSFEARFHGDRRGHLRLSSEEQVNRILEALKGKTPEVSSVKDTQTKKHPAPPFTTSTMQQEASRKFGMQSRKIMSVAQKLYEGINLGTEFGGIQGLITYMRTDSLRVSDEAQAQAKAYIEEKYSKEYYPARPNNYQAKAGAQDAHEAIRPSRMDLEPAKIRKFLNLDEYRLYRLIWDRFVASQMASAEVQTRRVDIKIDAYTFRVTGSRVTFPGYMTVYEELKDEQVQRADVDSVSENIRLPDLEAGTKLELTGLERKQHFTEPPLRYTEASLIRALEELGIGRPSTITPIITTIVERGYVKRDGKSLLPTDLGKVTTDLMNDYFPDIVDYKFTAQLETRLDGIEQGEGTSRDVLEQFWGPFESSLKVAEEKLDDKNVKLKPEKLDAVCEKCGAPMVLKTGKFGKFAACSNYPNCRNTKQLAQLNNQEFKKMDPVLQGEKCEKCGAPLVLRNGKFGVFYACSNYPNCRYTKQHNRALDVPCPKCGSKILVRYGRNHMMFFGCERYPDCDFSSWDMPLDKKCPVCGGMLFRHKGRDGHVLVCKSEGCTYSEPDTMSEEEVARLLSAGETAPQKAED